MTGNIGRGGGIRAWIIRIESERLCFGSIGLCNIQYRCIYSVCESYFIQ